jgi:microcystin-dependent protein
MKAPVTMKAPDLIFKNLKTTLFLVTFFLSTLSIFAQEIAIQGIARDEFNAARIDETINLSFEVYYRDGSNNEQAIFEQTEAVMTDEFGVFSTTINLTSASEPRISANKAYLRISEGTIEISNEKFKSVPYAVSAQNGVPTGSIMPYVGATAPAGWLLCDGSTIPNTDENQILRALIGSNTPNLQAMFLRGRGEQVIAGRTFVGPDLEQVQADEFKSHNHGAGNLQADAAGGYNPANGDYKYLLKYTDGSSSAGSVDNSSGEPNVTSKGQIRPIPNHTHTISGNTGSTGGSETRPVNFGVNYIIKL